MNHLGQLIFTGIKGTLLDEEERDFLKNENIGGVILFADNYENPAQLAELINEIQTTRDEYPLFIGVDHEGGRVQRFKKNFTFFPSSKDLSTLNSPKIVYEAYSIMAQELHACGVNLNFAPCCDILTNKNNNVIGDRSFGEGQEVVGKYITAAIRGLMTNHILACAKHFPGHGSSTKDSHFDLPIVKTPIDEIKNNELQPFNKAIKSRVDFVMMAHLQVDSIDPTLPASLSPIHHEILRKELRFNKIIISDDMEMKAIVDHFKASEAPIMALKAGTDILLYRTSSAAKCGLQAIKEALKTKAIKNDLIKEKINRILAVKKENFTNYNPIYIPAIEKKINTATSIALLDSIKKSLSNIT